MPYGEGMQQVAWQDAVAAIEALVRARVAARPVHAQALPALVGITGPMASGKSTLAAALGGLVVSTDRYLPDYGGLPEHAWDLPESSDLERLAADLAALRGGRPAKVPTWSFRTHARSGEEVLDPRHLVVVEGLHALDARVREHLDVRVLVDAPRDERWRRCVERERRGERGWSIEYVERFFAAVAEPTFDAHGRRAAEGADLVVMPGAA
jgi:uridine kinase